MEFGSALVWRGSRERVVPIITTVVVAGLALAPLALSGAAAGEEIVRPMAAVVLGGLVTSAVLILLVIPVLYLRFGRALAPAPAPRDVVVLPDVDPVGG
jgi:Cu/Ag efflux pump CusA